VLLEGSDYWGLDTSIVSEQQHHQKQQQQQQQQREREQQQQRDPSKASTLVRNSYEIVSGLPSAAYLTNTNVNTNASSSSGNNHNNSHSSTNYESEGNDLGSTFDGTFDGSSTYSMSVSLPSAVNGQTLHNSYGQLGESKGGVGMRATAQRKIESHHKVWSDELKCGKVQ
jgi:hypothetical protein